MHSIRMIATDLDNTWLRSDKTESAHARRVIDALRRRGVRFVIATARPVRGVRQALPWLDYDAAVFHNGAVVYDGGVRVGGAPLGDARSIVARILLAHPDCHLAMEADDQLFANFDPGGIWRGIEYVATRDFAQLESRPVDKLIIECATLAQMEAYRPCLPEDAYMHLSEGRIAMIMSRRATKLAGVELLARRHGIPLKQVAAFGDDYNDEEMLRACGVGVAMGDALEDVKAAADDVCGTCDEDGVARWLERLL